jgi:metal-responsive CopG/Arc/MetJ family transcriptional regulator
MSKRVISFRLSESELAALDLACQRFSESRSQVISRAIRSLMEEYVDDGKTITRRPYWLADLDEGK